MQDSIFEQASSARLNGDNQTAIRLCQAILGRSPQDANAKSLLGVSLAEIGAIDEARPFINEALQSEPNNWRFLLNQSVLHECESDLPNACLAAENASKNAPDRFEVWGRLGDLYGKAENYAGAADALKKAVAINPNHPALALRLASACYEIADYASATTALDQFEALAPGYPDALPLRTYIARQTSDWDGLLAAAQAWLRAAPEEETARGALAFAHAQQAYFNRAIEVYKPLVDAAPENPDHLATLGKYSLSARRFEDAENYFKRALAVAPSHGEASAGLGRMNAFLGNFDEAIAHCRKAIQSNPKYIEAYGTLALASGSRLTEEEISQLRTLGNDVTLDLEARALSYFTAGDALHRMKDYSSAFDSWSQANSLKLEIARHDPTAGYDREGQSQFATRIINAFQTDPTGTTAPDNAGPAPIFIVGMPRSGTTLLESAIGAHAEVSCAGELPVMPFALNEFFSWAESSGWRNGEVPADLKEAIRQKYYTQYQDYQIELAPFIIDKQPNNFLSVGLIRHAFPEAKIIHIRRNPMETGFSIFRRDFSKSWQFANSLKDIAHYYAIHSRVTEHWRKTINANYTFVQYETLVRDFENELRRLIGFCGLAWDQNCLEYYEQDRTVITFSASQVRKPPSPEHLNSTAPYEKFLAPLKEGLQSAGIDLETGALISSA